MQNLHAKNPETRKHVQRRRITLNSEFTFERAFYVPAPPRISKQPGTEHPHTGTLTVRVTDAVISVPAPV
jgi:hypothetical protein